MDKAEGYESYVAGNLSATWQAWFEEIKLILLANAVVVETTT